MRKLKLLVFGLLCALQLMAQNNVTGRVTDRAGNPVPNATITVKTTRTSTVSDEQGNFSISAPLNSTLIITHVSFGSTEVNVTSGTVNVQLNEAAALSEVVVTGYRQRSKREFAGSAGTVKGETIRSVPIASFDQALQGQTPGLILRASSGQPGNSGSAIIRGRGSIQGSTEPIYVVDGIQIAASDFALLNPADIDNVSVLKDAVGASLYGSRGGNGVIVITTKKGRSGKPNLDVEAFTGWSSFPKFRDFRLMNTNEKIDYELRRGGTSLSGYSNAEIDSLRKINTNWENLLTRTGRTYNVTGSAAGGSEKTKYYASANYFKQEGTLRNTGFDRITGRFNLNQEAGNFLFGLNTSGTYSNYNNTAELNASIASPLNGLQWANPYEQEFVPGRFTAAGGFVGGGTALVRPRITETGQPIPTTELFSNWNTTKQIRVIASGNAEYKIPFVQGLSVRTVLGIDYNQDEFQAFVDRLSYSAGSNPRPTTGSSANFRTSSFRRDYIRTQRLTNTNSINYIRNFGQHSLDVGVYYEYIKQKNANFGSTVFLLASPFQNEAGATVNGELLPVIRGGGGEGRLESYFGLMTYGFKNRYFINANIRRDASSRFGRDKRFATFSGVGVSWIVSDEGFFSGLRSVFSELKFKASYGTVGNQEGITFYEPQGLIQGRLYNAAAGTFQSTLENPDLQWEGRRKFNTGIDYSLFNNRVSGSLEYYNEVTGDLFLPQPLSNSTGFISYTVNIGAVKNSGVEFSANTEIIRNKNFRLSFNGNITYNKNQVTALSGRDSVVSGLVVRAIGQPINSLFLVEYAGVNPQNGEAQYRKLDGTITENFSPNDKRIVGNADPNVFGGFGLNIDFKGITLTTQFTYMLGSKVYNNERVNLENPDYYYDNVNVDLLREWQRPGDVTDIPKPTSIFEAETTRFLESNSFVRLRNVAIGYTLPKRITDKLKMRGISVYASGTNLWVATKYRGRDPEFSGISVTGAQYPALKTVQVGARFNF